MGKNQSSKYSQKFLCSTKRRHRMATKLLEKGQSQKRQKQLVI